MKLTLFQRAVLLVLLHIIDLLKGGDLRIQILYEWAKSGEIPSEESLEALK